MHALISYDDGLNLTLTLTNSPDLTINLAPTLFPTLTINLTPTLTLTRQPGSIPDGTRYDYLLYPNLGLGPTQAELRVLMGVHHQEVAKVARKLQARSSGHDYNTNPNPKTNPNPITRFSTRYCIRSPQRLSVVNC